MQKYGVEEKTCHSPEGGVGVLSLPAALLSIFSDTIPELAIK